MPRKLKRQSSSISLERSDEEHNSDSSSSYQRSQRLRLNRREHNDRYYRRHYWGGDYDNNNGRQNFGSSSERNYYLKFKRSHHLPLDRRKHNDNRYGGGDHYWGGDYDNNNGRGGLKDNGRRVWYPNELQRQEILVELYQDASSETADVAFSVGKTVFKVHKNILSLRVKELNKIVEDCDPDTPFPIDSMKPEIFKSVLDFAYTVKTPEIGDEVFATDLLIAADCYDCIHLKLFVESVLVDKFLKAENAASLLLLADSHNCALLKEAVVGLFLAEAETIKKTEGWSGIRQSNRLLEELLDSVLFSNKTGGDKNDIDHLDVGALRDELQEANLPLDGSREVLVNRLKEHRQSSESAASDDESSGSAASDDESSESAVSDDESVMILE